MVFFLLPTWPVVGERYHAFFFQATMPLLLCAVILIGGFIAAAVTMAGWFITDYLRRRDTNDTHIENFIEKQITELYAPLYFLAESEFRYRQMRDKAVSAVSEEKKLEIWWAYSEKFIVPAQLQIYDLLKTKWHLLIDGQIHQSIDDVIAHCTDAISLFTLDKQGTRVDASISATGMPDTFLTDIKKDLSTLRHEYNVFKVLKRRNKK